MIIKFLSRKSNSGQLLQYICRYIFDDKKLQKADLIQPGTSNMPDKFLIRHNVRSRSIKGFLKEFNENESYRLVHRKDSVKVFHTIISFSPKDRELLNDKILKDIAKKFIEERGVNSLYIGTKHEDKDHLHLHICSSGTQLNGRSARVSNQKLRSIKLALDGYQREKYPFLINSQVEHGKRQGLSKEAMLSRLKANRQTNKAALAESLENIYAKSRSKAEFLSHIKAQGHEPYLRNGKLQGILLDGKTKYRFTRLGFDQDRFELLDRIKANMNDTLLQLGNLRKGLRMEKEKEMQPAGKRLEHNTAEEAGLKQLSELSAIRIRAKEHEKDKDDASPRIRGVNEDERYSDEEADFADTAPIVFSLPVPKLLSIEKQ